MFKSIAVFGAIAGLIVGIPLFLITTFAGKDIGGGLGLLVGYTTMLVALSFVFVAVKRRRDADLGGVIGFWPALGLGLGISVVAGIFYVVAWEAALAVTHMDFAGEYARATIAQAQAKGISGEAMEQLRAQMDQFKAQYANPLYRVAETFAEIFPVGVIVSIISAALLCNRRFLPARRT
jgi:hypothetical protein